jgi:hypothetical protein
MCAINRISIYVVLGILINLSALTFELVFVIFKGDKSLNKKLLNATSTVVPFALAAVGFALEGNVDAPQLQHTCATQTHGFIFLTFACIVCVCVCVSRQDRRRREWKIEYGKACLLLQHEV